MNEIARLRASAAFAFRAPAHFAYAGQHICDGLLLAMMVNSRTGTLLDLKQAAPQRRFDAELRRNCSLAFRAGRLQRALVEFRRVNDTDCRGIAHRFQRGYHSKARDQSRPRHESSSVKCSSLSYVGRRGSRVGSANPNLGMRQTSPGLRCHLGASSHAQMKDGARRSSESRSRLHVAEIVPAGQ